MGLPIATSQGPTSQKTMCHGGSACWLWKQVQLGLGSTPGPAVC